MKENTFLANGNKALQYGQFAESICSYVNALFVAPELSTHIINNLALARKRYRASRETVLKPDVAVSCWELAHNPAGRAYTLAMLYQAFANVEIIGTIVPRFGREIWEPIRDTQITKKFFIVEDDEQFIKQAVELVLANPYDIVHLSKPRAFNIFIGVLYKVIWGSKVLMDIDDEELAFVGADTPVDMEEHAIQHDVWPIVIDLAGKTWTRIAVGMVNEFDGVTVSNIAIQQRYGGVIIHHARDGSAYNLTVQQKLRSREKFGISTEKKVILFFGTPREHKGLIETANAIASLNRKDVIFAIVGDFPDSRLKKKLQDIDGVDYCFVENQPFSLIPHVIAIGDICVLIQDQNSQVSKFQIPAKLSDALAMGIPVLASNMPSLAEVFSAGAAIPVTVENLPDQINNILIQPEIAARMRECGMSYFKNFLDMSDNANLLKRLINSCLTHQPSFLTYKLFKSIFSKNFVKKQNINLIY